jgi:hypothetical protein
MADTAYATPDDFFAWVQGSQSGATRVANLMQETDGDARELLIQQALNAAAAAMDSRIAVAGYAVPVDASASTLPDECAALLLKLCISKTLDQLSPGTPPALPDGFKTEPSWADKFLKGLRGGPGIDPITGGVTFNGLPKEVLPGVARSKSNVPAWDGA